MSDKIESPGVVAIHNDGRQIRAHLCKYDDVVAGNRYQIDDATDRFVPDDAGPWLALVTYRGPKAPPRPEVLPVGTRVRRGPDWSPERGWYSDEPGIGLVESWSGFPDVRWPSGNIWSHWWEDERHCLEVVSLPEPAKAETWPADAVPTDLDDHLIPDADESMSGRLPR